MISQKKCFLCFSQNDITGYPPKMHSHIYFHSVSHSHAADEQVIAAACTVTLSPL